MESTYTLEERLDCLCSMLVRLRDYRHVIDPTHPIYVQVQDEINNIVNELERRDEIVS